MELDLGTAAGQLGHSSLWTGAGNMCVYVVCVYTTVSEGYNNVLPLHGVYYFYSPLTTPRTFTYKEERRLLTFKSRNSCGLGTESI